LGLVASLMTRHRLNKQSEWRTADSALKG